MARRSTTPGSLRRRRYRPARPGPARRHGGQVDAVARCGRNFGKVLVEGEQALVSRAGEQMQGVCEVEPA